MKKIKNNIVILKIIFILVLIIAPWINADYFDGIKAQELVQEDLSFYEINPCKVSLSEFIINEFNSSYQDHYFFRFNDSSSISCFGRVSGVTLINNSFYISIGTNSILNLIIQGLFWITLISFIKPDKEKIQIGQSYYAANLLAVLYFCYSIFAEKRFYEQKLYLFDLTKKISFVIIFVLLFFIIKNLNDVIIKRFYKLINFLPATYLLIGVFSGYNLTIYSFILTTFGFIALITKEYNKNINLTYVLFSIFWINNSAGRFSFYPDKLRGFTSTSYDFNSVLSWAIFIFLLINGLIYLFRKAKDYLDLDKLLNVFCISGISILILGYMGANFPIINFFNYYYFGQQKYGVKIQNPFSFNQWSEKIAWRGFYPSAESIGEYFGLILILIIFMYFKNRKLSKLHLVTILVSLLGLYFSDNRSAFILTLLTLTYFLLSTIKLTNKIKFLLLTSTLLTLIFLVGFQNLSYPYFFSSEYFLNKGIQFKSEGATSSSLNYLINIFESKGISYYLISIPGFLSFLLNRSIVWGMFFSRYNPSAYEFLLGSGPFNFGKLYGEVPINEPGYLLLPHSSLLSFMLFCGVIGILLLLFYIGKKLITERKNITTEGYIILLFIFLNIIKNDTLNYLSSFVLYSFFTYMILNLNIKKNFYR